MVMYSSCKKAISELYALDVISRMWQSASASGARNQLRLTSTMYDVRVRIMPDDR